MHRLNDPDDEDLIELEERCVGVATDESGWTRETYGRMRRRSIKTEDEFEGLPVMEPPGYARP